MRAGSASGPLAAFAVAAVTAGAFVLPPVPQTAGSLSFQSQTAAGVAAAADYAAPGSSASAPAIAGAGPVPVAYSAADVTSEVAFVELWTKAPGDATFAVADVDLTPDSPGFEYEAEAGPGEYELYTRAADTAGNYEEAPAVPDAVTTAESGEGTAASGRASTRAVAPEAAAEPDGEPAPQPGPRAERAPSAGGGGAAAEQPPVDATAPETTIASAVYGEGSFVQIEWLTLGDQVAEVELWASPPGADEFVLAEVVGAGSLRYQASAGEGEYRFYVRSRDAAGNYEDAPAEPDATVIVVAP